ncbi:unnamed protein product [Euphydryas editha]|uniref:Uncharacterized protein n=1 Tax=Euphydryas editha TaxID=104508 RepID=A0AAU9UGR8_EUPED|nr:unnamed protein product [Euphydryas editha]
MVTSYYIMKMAKNKDCINVDEYFDNLYNAPISKDTIKQNSKCRVCLKDGAVLIFGDENKCDITEALQIFADIELNEDDGFPKHLCRICYKFIKSAIMFRKIARKTNDTLKQQLITINNLEDVWNDPSNDTNSEKKSLEQGKQNISLKKLCEKEKIENETKNMKVQCQICKKIIKKSYYKIHMTMHDPDHHKFICDICGKTFRLRVGYHNHRLRHRNDYPFKCQLCPYKGRYSERLKSHMRTHSGEYRYMCTECPARFLFKGNLNTHILLKHKEPQFKCETCDKTFHTKLKLQIHHEADHLGIKNHVCNICGRAFGYRNAMMKHQRRVHKREKLRFSYNLSNKDNHDVI